MPFDAFALPSATLLGPRGLQPADAARSAAALRCGSSSSSSRSMIGERQRARVQARVTHDVDDV